MGCQPLLELFLFQILSYFLLIPGNTTAKSPNGNLDRTLSFEAQKGNEHCKEII